MTQNRKILAYEALKDKIIQGQLPEGEPISEKQITEELGISRTPLREAMSMLEQEHLLEIHAKRGVFVTRISYKDINNIYSVRIILEPYGVRQAIGKIPNSDLVDFERIWDEVPPNDTPEAHIERDIALHRRIATATDNKYLIQFLTRLHDQARRIRFLSLQRVQTRQQEVNYEHMAIIQALLDENGEAAETAMLSHLERARETALKVFGA